jgi:DNA topoisomerase-1
VVEKPKRSSLQGAMTESTVTLEEALKLLSLPRVVGVHPDDNEPIVTNFGRFGPYVKHKDEFRSLESEDDVFSISFDAALALILAPKQSRRRQSAAKTVIKELAKDGLTIKLLSGRYGPYVTDGSLNASLPKTMNPDALTYEQAVELLAARKDAAPMPRRGGFKRRAAKSTGSKPRARKAAGA